MRSTSSGSTGSAPAAPRRRAGSERLWGTLQDRLRVRAAAGGRQRRSRRRTSCSPGTCPATTAASRSSRPSPTPAWRSLAVGPAARGRAVLRVPAPGSSGTRRSAGTAAALALPRRRGGAGWAGRRVVVQERLDGSLWARDDRELYPLVAAPPTAPVLRARKLNRVPELVDATGTTRSRSSDPGCPSAAATAREAEVRSPLAPLSCGATTVTKSLSATRSESLSSDTGPPGAGPWRSAGRRSSAPGNRCASATVWREAVARSPPAVRHAPR